MVAAILVAMATSVAIEYKMMMPPLPHCVAFFFAAVIFVLLSITAWCTYRISKFVENAKNNLMWISGTAYHTDWVMELLLKGLSPEVYKEHEEWRAEDKAKHERRAKKRGRRDGVFTHEVHGGAAGCQQAG